MVDEGRLTARSARELFPELVDSGGDPEALMQAARSRGRLGYAGELEAAVDDAIASNPKVVESYHSGDAKALNFLMGQVMKRTQGKANPGHGARLAGEEVGQLGHSTSHSSASTFTLVRRIHRTQVFCSRSATVDSGASVHDSGSALAGSESAKSN